MDKTKTRKLKKPKYAASEDDSDCEESLEHDTKKKSKKQIPVKKNTKTNKRKKEVEDEDEEDDEFLPEELSNESVYTEGEENSDSMSGEDVSMIEQKVYLKKKKKRNNSIVPNIPNGIAVKEKSNIKETATKDTIQKDNLPRTAKKEKFILDPNFNLETSYFYQDVNKSQWDQIRIFVLNYLKDNKTDVLILRGFFSNYSNLRKGEHNIIQLRKIIDNQFASYSITENLFKSYKSISDFLISEYYSCKPTLFECHFFPNLDNEVHVVNMIRTCKKTLDIAIFCITNDRIYAAIEEAHKRGIKVRIITDDECCKMSGSEIARCAAIGIPTKTDDSARANMHHKFAVIDYSVVVTGSFNWTNQAVKINQENILFFENKELAAKYTEEYNRLWNLFTTVVDPKISILKVKEEDEKIRRKLEDKEKEKENKKKEREKEKESKKKDKGNEKETKRRLNFSPKKESLKSTAELKVSTEPVKKEGGCVIF